MQYMLLIYGNEAYQPTSEEAARPVLAAYGAYGEALRKAGVLVHSARLRNTDTATSVRVADGKNQVLNGPFAETKEQLGGYYLLELPDMDAALDWAARCPGAAHGAVEVRPIWPM